MLGYANNSDGNAQTVNVGCIEVTKVIRDFVPLVEHEYGSSFGEIVDAQLREAALSGGEVLEVKLMIDPEQWKKFACDQMQRKDAREERRKARTLQA